MNNPDIQYRSGNKWVRRLYVSAVAGLFLVAACQQKMAQQPSFRPQEETNFYPDGRSARPLERGTIALGQLIGVDPLMTGLTAQGQEAKVRVDVKVPKDSEDAKYYSINPQSTAPIPIGAPYSLKSFVDDFPFKMTEDRLERGKQRYTIFCTPCHGVLGDGNGKIVERGFGKPTSYYGENSRGFARFNINKPLTDVPVGYLFEVVSKGYGEMPDYSAQISAEDRWCIVAYIRALQLSQGVKLEDLPKNVQEAADKALGQKETAEGKKP